jgi:hypothetical protein
VIRLKVQLLATGLSTLLLFPPFRTSAKESKLNLDELVAKHLDAMGSAEVRSGVRVRSAKGTVTFDERISGNINLEGTSFFVSQGRNFKCTLEFGAPQYVGEQFVYDGQKVQVALMDQRSRSVLGNFLLAEPEVLAEGLWGGSLNVAWPLLDRKTNGASLKYGGLKKIEGRDLYELNYVPKNRTAKGEFEVHLYFESRTLHHVLTVYRLYAPTVETGQVADTHGVTTTVEERFTGYQTSEGMTLPLEWEIRARVEPGKAEEFQWKIKFTGITSIHAVANGLVKPAPAESQGQDSSFYLVEEVPSLPVSAPKGGS